MRALVWMMLAVVGALVLGGCVLERCEWTPDTAIDPDASAEHAGD